MTLTMGGDPGADSGFDRSYHQQTISDETTLKAYDSHNELGLGEEARKAYGHDCVAMLLFLHVRGRHRHRLSSKVLFLMHLPTLGI